LCTLTVLTSFSQSEDSVYYTNPEYHVAKELFNKRIVMLGDYAHHTPGPFRRVINSLENWLQISSAGNESTNLTLVIEDEKAVTDEINKYFSTGDIKPLIDTIAPDFYLEDLEYYANLRNFSLKVDSVNQSRINKITFKINGFEQVGRVNFEQQAKKPKKESELWFVNERDSTTAMGLMDYMESNPKEQILMFYGAAHLICGFVNKNLGFDDLSDQECMGYYLPHYLKKQFGDNNVVIFLPCNFLYYYKERPFNHPALDTLRDKLILVNSKYFADTASYFGADYVISVHNSYGQPMDANFVCSRFILEKTSEALNRVSQWLQGYGAKSFYNKYLGAAHLLTGQNFRNDSETTEWLNNNKYNGSDYLFSNQLTDSLSSQFVKSYNKDYINSIISIFGVAYEITDSDMKYFEQWKQQELPMIIRHIKFTNSIGIYWFGYPDEKIKAKEYLKEFSREDFQEPEKYVQWYRMKFYGYNY
jgi:hypothetical protein